MRLLIILVQSILLVTNLFAQEKVKAHPETLITLAVGKGESEVFFNTNDEGFFSPGSPFVDSNGTIVFGSHANASPLTTFINQGLVSFDPQGDSFPIQVIGTPFQSQEGIGLASTTQWQFADNRFIAHRYLDKYEGFSADYLTYNYPTPFGAIIYSDKEQSGVAVVFDVLHPQEDFLVIPQDRLKSWLMTQSGGFAIGDDGHLYRNGVLWSVIKPKGIGGNYLGRLASGHAVWDAGDTLYIANAEQEIEVQVDIPWANQESPNHGFENHGIGPWGEVYYLIPPPWIPTGKKASDHGGGFYEIYKFDETKPAQLVVIRNYLKYFGRLNDGGVRLRRGPTSAGEILGAYPAKTGFRILEQGDKEETIGGQKNVWYKVRLLDGKEGWFFGSFVQNLYDGPNGKPPPWPNVPDW